MSEWLPIETAPKDGSAVLGYFPGYDGVSFARRDVIAMYWSGWGGGIWDCASSGHHIHQSPTHWMPLPSPPDSKEKVT
jgi:hypothetical protein